MSVKIFLGFAVVFLLRLIPWRLPNVEPVLATLTPFAKNYGKITGFLYAFLSIALFDLFVGQVGVWTLVTAVCYGLVGLAAGIFFSRRDFSRINLLWFAIVSTLLYDIITGPIMSTIIFNQSLIASSIGQIPFTLNHLAGNIILCVVLSPILHRWIVTNPALETHNLWQRIKYN